MSFALDSRPSSAAKNAGISLTKGETMADAAARTTWIHVAPYGVWKGHSNGEFSLTDDHFKSVCSVIAAKSTPPSSDYEHASIRPTGRETPASGYVLAAEVRADGLYALVEFTKRAGKLIEDGEYRFCSGVFDFTSVDPVTGEPQLCVLDTVALTNRPFLDGQHPIVLSQFFALTSGETMKEIDMKALAKLLDAIPGPNTAEKIKKAIDLMASGDAPDAPAAVADASRRALNVDPAAPAVALADKPADAAPCADPPMPAMPMTDMPPAEAPAEAAADDIDARFMAATGLDDAGYAAALDANFDAIVALLLGNASTAALSRDLETTSLRTKLNAATVELNVFRADAAKRLDAEVATEVDAAIAAGKWLPGQKVIALAMARKDLKGFRDLTASQPVNPLLVPHASAHAAPPGQSENANVKLAKDHPRVVALSVALKASGLDQKVVDAKLAELTG